MFEWPSDFREIHDNAPVGFMSTVSEDNKPHVRPMTCRLLDNGRLWSASFSDSGTVKELRRHPSVEFCFMDDRKPVR